MNQTNAARTPSGFAGFGSKAETLQRLAPLLTHARVLPLHTLTCGAWARDPEAALRGIPLHAWGAGPLAVRSSALNEDTATRSLAGHYLSLLNVDPATGLREAISKVIASYGAPHDGHQVLIQPMLTAVTLSGVAFSSDPSTGSPYHIINYDPTSGSTTSVTSGTTNSLRTHVCFKGKGALLPPELRSVAALLEELETLTGTRWLDVEFARDRQGTLYLLQCRPLTSRPGDVFLAAGPLEKALEVVAARTQTLIQPHPYLHGSRTILGVMPDWNPAEIIGVRPRPLALSLYKELVTDAIWAYQRDNYGYRNLRSFPLLIDLYGLPYVDVRVSFNSFIPKDIDGDLGDRLVNHYIDQLLAAPSLHDKVEFDIVYTCYTLDLPERVKRLHGHGFSEGDTNQLVESLRALTNAITHSTAGLWRKDAAKVENLRKRLDTIRQSRLDKVGKIYWLLEDCKRYGTLPFAGLARAGFIAVQMLRSLTSVGIFSREEYDGFLGSLNTVSSTMNRDFHTLSKPAFLEKYGHLRPGTYDILCPRYDEDPDRYFDWSTAGKGWQGPSSQFALSLTQLKRIENELKGHRLNHEVLDFFDFIKSAIEGREYAKFIFTRSLSDALVLFRELALENGFTEEECSFAHIDVVKQLYSSSYPIKTLLRKSIEAGRERFAYTSQICLPPLIVNPDEVWAFEVPAAAPNFITQRKVTAHRVEADAPLDRLKGGIVFIPSADPGYDWLFSHPIKGLITLYGGVNSHMAIRAGELGIPAVIGAGERYYREWSKGQLLELDCQNQWVRVLK